MGLFLCLSVGTVSSPLIGGQHPGIVFGNTQGVPALRNVGSALRPLVFRQPTGVVLIRQAFHIAKQTLSLRSRLPFPLSLCHLCLRLSVTSRGDLRHLHLDKNFS